MKKSNWHGGKGSTPRTDTNSKQYQDNWDKIFGPKIKPEEWDKNTEKKEDNETIRTKNAPSKP